MINLETFRLAEERFESQGFSGAACEVEEVMTVDSGDRAQSIISEHLVSL